MEPSTAGTDAIQPVASISSHTVRPGQNDAFEEWLQGSLRTMSAHRGYCGSTVIRPVPGSSEYVVAAHFSRQADLDHWLASPERAETVAAAEPLVQGDSRHSTESGAETWLQPKVAPPRPPARYKMAILVGVVIYPLLVLVIPAVGWLLGDYSFLASPVTIRVEFFTRILVIAAIIVPIMTFIALPELTKRFRGWLYPVS